MKKTQFIPSIAPLVVKENKRRGNPLFSSVVIAQAICESGWGQATIMMKANAIFGIKATSSWKGRVYNANTKECHDGVNYTTLGKTAVTDGFEWFVPVQGGIEDGDLIRLGVNVGYILDAFKWE